MSTFPARWLMLREPFDHAARSEALVAKLAAALPERPLVGAELGCGLGSGARYLMPRLGGRWRWTLIDHDPALLAELPAHLERWGAAHGSVRREGDRVTVGSWSFEPLRLDLRTLDDLPPADLISTQALLDLVSYDWLVALADLLATRRVPLIAALTVDGRVTWRPRRVMDGEVEAAFRLHQLGDRGFGTSPGPGAAQLLADLLRVRGFRVSLKRADWRVGPRDHAMLGEMVRGHAHAAGEVHPDPARVRRWETARLHDVTEERLSLRVGHLDLLALP